jgi:NTP pyrophosphatase (non-canonical NTP hydrolase)
VKAETNVERWGEQSVETLVLAATEELGELSRAHLEARDEDGDPDRLLDEIDDLAALCVQLRAAARTEAKDEDR